MSREAEERIGALAARQYGALTYRQLLEAGLSSSGVARRLRSGRLRRLHQGVYLALPCPLARTRQMAAVLATGQGAVLSDFSAGEVLGLAPRSEGRANEAVDVTAPRNRSYQPGTRLHRRRLLRGEWMVAEGIPITTPARTILDLAAVLDAGALEAAIARAERGRVDHA